MALLLGLGLVPRPIMTFCFSLGVEEDGCPLAEALDVVIEAFAKPSVRWQDASMTNVETLAAAIDELEAGGGTEDFEIFDAESFGAEAFGALGFPQRALDLMALACVQAPFALISIA